MEKTLILTSGKCSWGKCFACGWGKLEAPVNPVGLKEKIQRMDFQGIDRLKVFCSGSFLDDVQFPKEFRKWFTDYVKNRGVKELVVESRPEFVKKQSLEDFKGINLTVAIGLEAADNLVLKKYRKGFKVEDYVKAVETLKENNCSVRTYLMVNIPFGSQQVLDKSVKFALKYSDSIVLINTFPHAKADLFEDWVSGKWKPLDRKQFQKAVKKWEKNKKIELDFQNYLFIPKFPREKKILLKGVGIKFLDHAFYNVWQDYFQRFYEKPVEKTIALFLPCSYKKPYFKSETHRKINEALRQLLIYKKIHKIVISSPGVIPFEFCDNYPFNAYDWEEWLETPEIKKQYIKITEKRCEEYLKKHKYEEYYCYLKYDAESFIALKKACRKKGIKLKNLLDEKVYEKIKEQKNPLVLPEALESLKKNLNKI